MTDFWENNFKAGNLNWGNEPADSAILANEIFITNKVKNILIPGIGYGRNANIFIKNGIKVSGIEISQTAIGLAKTENNLNIKIHHGSVMDMPFDKAIFDGIFCYALLHLLNKPQRQKFLRNCYSQLNVGGYMIFTMVSDKVEMFGQGKLLSKNRYQLENGLRVYFYDAELAEKEFLTFGLKEIKEIDEPIKFMKNQPPLKLIMAVCQKN